MQDAIVKTRNATETKEAKEAKMVKRFWKRLEKRMNQNGFVLVDEGYMYPSIFTKARNLVMRGSEVDVEMGWTPDDLVYKPDDLGGFKQIDLLVQECLQRASNLHVTKDKEAW
jgi:hypothetical protein